MSKKLTTQIRAAEKKRAHLVDELLRLKPLLKGSLSLTKRTCGKSNCHCAKEPAHPAWTLATRKDGKQRCQVVRQDDVEVVRERVERYRRFKEVLRRLRAIETEQKRRWRGLIEERNLPYK